MGCLVALAVRPARIAALRVPAPPIAQVRAARRLGWGFAAVVALGVAIQAHWIADHLEFVRPMSSGDPAPAFSLQEIGPAGALGERVTLASSRGKITVLDFWATWCAPCLASMPRLDKLARKNPDVAVIAINLDDPALARALFDKQDYAMQLLAGDDDVAQRYGASSIPHTVVLDRDGMVRQVVSGTGPDLAALVETIRTSDRARSRSQP
jgi:thiol-disulfide isomerase/thioredoxin